MTRLAFSMHENKGVYALLLGSGISSSAGIPTGWQITLNLIRKVAELEGVDPQPDWERWFIDTKGTDPKYSDIINDLGKTAAERRSILHSYIEPNEDEREQKLKIPTLAHHAIANLVSKGYVRVIITTNFDRLLEAALNEQGIQPTVISSVDSLRGAQPYTHSTCYVVKLHGDYLDARIRNTEDELSEYPAEFNTLLDRLLDEFGLIICGWSGDWDDALRGALMRSPNRRYSHYWTHLAELSERAQGIASHTNAHLVKIDSADQFFSALSESIECIETSSQNNPVTIDLLVRLTKSLLSKPESKIQLNDLFDAESALLWNKLESFDAPSTITNEFIQSRIRDYENACDRMIHLAFLLGRWGDSSYLNNIKNLVKSIHKDCYDHWLGRSLFVTRLYPCVLLFYSFGLGLVASRQFRTLRQLYREDLEFEHRENESFADNFYLWNWRAGRSSDWNQIYSINRVTPFSEHLYELFNSLRLTSHANEPFSDLFDRFEILASLSCYDKVSRNILEDIIKRPEEFYKVPYGRLVWHSNKPLDIQKEPLMSELLESGFAASDPVILDFFVENFERARTYSRWHA